MANVFTHQLVAHIGTGTTVATVYTAPGPEVTVLRDISLSVAADATNIQLYVATPGSNVPFELVANLAPNSTFRWEGRAALNPGDQLGVVISTTGTWYLFATGYVFR